MLRFVLFFWLVVLDACTGRRTVSFFMFFKEPAALLSAIFSLDLNISSIISVNLFSFLFDFFHKVQLFHLFVSSNNVLHLMNSSGSLFSMQSLLMIMQLRPSSVIPSTVASVSPAQTGSRWRFVLHATRTNNFD